jgi:hypothetical protein
MPKKMKSQSTILLKLIQPQDLSRLVADIKEFSSRNPLEFSSPSRVRFKNTIGTTKVHLNTGVLAA